MRRLSRKMYSHRGEAPSKACGAGFGMFFDGRSRARKDGAF
jgi:hypothetical protein